MRLNLEDSSEVKLLFELKNATIKRKSHITTNDENVIYVRIGDYDEKK